MAGKKKKSSGGGGSCPPGMELEGKRRAERGRAGLASCKLETPSAGVMNETVGEMVQSGAGLCAPLVLLARRLCPPSIASVEKKSIPAASRSRSSVRLLFGLCPVGRRLVDQSAEMSGHRRTVPTASCCCCESMPLSTSTWSSADGCQAVRVSSALEQAVRLRSLDCPQ